VGKRLLVGPPILMMGSVWWATVRRVANPT